MKPVLAVKTGSLILVVVMAILIGSLCVVENHQQQMLDQMLKREAMTIASLSLNMLDEQDIQAVSTLRQMARQRMPLTLTTGFDNGTIETRSLISINELSEIKQHASYQRLAEWLTAMMPIMTVDSDQIRYRLQHARFMAPISGIPPDRALMVLQGQKLTLQPDLPAAGDTEVTTATVGTVVSVAGDYVGLAAHGGEMQVVMSRSRAPGNANLQVAAPLVDEQGETIAVLVLGYVTAMDDAFVDSRSLTLPIALVGFVLVFMLSLLVGIMLTRPMYFLRLGAERIREHQFTRPIPIASKDEFGELAKTLNALASDLAEADRHQAEALDSRNNELSTLRSQVEKLNDLLKQDNLELGAELSMILRMREGSFAASSFLSRLNNWDISLDKHLAPKMGGDFFEVIEGQDNKVWVVQGTVSGFGVETALMTMLVKASVTALFKRVGGKQDLPALMARLNAGFCDLNSHLGLDRHVSLLVYYQQDSRNLVMSGQYENPWLFRAGGSEQALDTSGLGVPLGVDSNAEEHFKYKLVNMEGSDALVLLSPGWISLIDRRQGALERQLKKVVKLNLNLSSQDILQLLLRSLEPLLRDVRQHQGAMPDDLTLAVIKRRTSR